MSNLSIVIDKKMTKLNLKYPYLILTDLFSKGAISINTSNT